MEKLLQVTRSIDSTVYKYTIGGLSKLLKEIIYSWDAPVEVLGGISFGNIAVLALGSIVAFCISSRQGKFSRKISKIADNYPTLFRIAVLGGTLIVFIIIAL